MLVYSGFNQAFEQFYSYISTQIAEQHNSQDRSSLGSKASVDVLRLHLHSIIPPKPFFRMFTRPFRRKSAPSSPALPPKTYRSSSVGPSDSVKVLTLRKKRIRVLKRRLRKRMDVYVNCRVPSRTLFRKRRKPHVALDSSNCVVSAANHDAWHGFRMVL